MTQCYRCNANALTVHGELWCPNCGELTTTSVIDAIATSKETTRNPSVLPGGNPSHTATKRHIHTDEITIDVEGTPCRVRYIIETYGNPQKRRAIPTGIAGPGGWMPRYDRVIKTLNRGFREAVGVPLVYTKQFIETEMAAHPHLARVERTIRSRAEAARAFADRDDIMSIGEVAEVFGINNYTVTSYAKHFKLPSVKVRARRMFLRNAVMAAAEKYHATMNAQQASEQIGRSTTWVYEHAHDMWMLGNHWRIPIAEVERLEREMKR